MQTRVDHIGVVVSDLRGAVEELERCFGLSVSTTATVPERGIQAAFLPWGDISVELIEIEGRPTPPGFHHLAIGVDDLDEAVRVVRGQGMETTTEQPVLLAERRTIFVEPRTPASIRLQLLDDGPNIDPATVA